MAKRRLTPVAYRAALAAPGARPLLASIAVSYLGDGMSAVTIAWLALQIAPAGHASIFVGGAVAAYGLPTVIGTFALGRFLYQRSARALVLADSTVRTVLLATIAILRGCDALTPAAYLALLVGSSLLAAWGVAGKYTLLSEVVGPAHRLAVNAIISALGSAAVIAGPAIAGVLVGPVGPGWLIAADAASFAYLGLQTWRTRPAAVDAEPDAVAPVDAAKATAGLRIIRAQHLLGLLALSWFFFFLYGPVEVALPIHVAHDLHAGAATLGTYWALFGVGALIGSFATTALRNRPPWATTFVIAAGWGLCLVPFGFGAPTVVTMIGLAVGGLIYGPFTPLTYALFQAQTPAAQMSTVLAARNAIMMLATPLGTVLGGPLTAALGASHTLALSGLATILLVLITAAGRQVRQRNPASAAVL
jgi:predicted MFS family arabinose efflux permease